MDSSGPLDRAILDFCRYARANGLSAGVKESVTAVQAAHAVGIAGKEAFKSALRAVLCSSRSEWEQFESIFQAFWAGGSQERARRDAMGSRTVQSRAPAEAAGPLLLAADQGG